MVPEFHDFPSTAITVEFWLQSIDTCRAGVPFSYAHGKYEKEDNSFLIFNYNSWWVVSGGFVFAYGRVCARVFIGVCRWERGRTNKARGVCVRCLTWPRRRCCSWSNATTPARG